MWEKKWEDASVEERMNVVRMYNKYYDNVNSPITMEDADAAWYGRRWVTIYFTFGVKPYNA